MARKKQPPKVEERFLKAVEKLVEDSGATDLSFVSGKPERGPMRDAGNDPADPARGCAWAIAISALAWLGSAGWLCAHPAPLERRMLLALGASRKGALRDRHH